MYFQLMYIKFSRANQTTCSSWQMYPTCSSKPIHLTCFSQLIHPTCFSYLDPSIYPSQAFFHLFYDLHPTCCSKLILASPSLFISIVFPVYSPIRFFQLFLIPLVFQACSSHLFFLFNQLAFFSAYPSQFLPTLYFQTEYPHAFFPVECL